MATTKKPIQKRPTTASKAINRLTKETYKINISGVNVVDCLGITPNEIIVFKTNLQCIMKEPIRKAEKVQKILDKCQFNPKNIAILIWMMTV